MLTPAKIKNHHFDASGRNAYKADSVDTFFEEVSESYEQMFRENGEMYKKIGLLAERLEEYRNDEDNIRNALLTAQRMAEKITREAQEKADSLINDAQQRAKTENDRTDAVINDKLQKAEYQIQAMLEEAKAQADKMIYDATYESKAAAVSARDSMIKEEAALEMMKVEVSKFKNSVLDAYNAQLALIEQLPEIVYAKVEEEKEAEEEVEAVAEVEEQSVEETAEEIAVVEEIAEEIVPENVSEEVNPAEDIDVEHLQQMIDETIDTDIEDEKVEAEADEEESAEDFESEEYIVPDIDEVDEEVEKLSKEISQEGSGDIMFTKPTRNTEETGFKVNLNNISAYGDAEEIGDEDEIDDFDEDDNDDNDGGISSKLKGFFRK